MEETEHPLRVRLREIHESQPNIYTRFELQIGAIVDFLLDDGPPELVVEPVAVPLTLESPGVTTTGGVSAQGAEELRQETNSIPAFSAPTLTNSAPVTYCSLHPDTVFPHVVQGEDGTWASCPGPALGGGI